MRAIVSGALWAQDAAAAPAAGRWIPDRLPAALQGVGPLGLAWWQWLAVPGLALAALLLARVLGALTRSGLHRIFRRTAGMLDDRWLASVGPALTALWATAIFKWGMPWLGLPAAAARAVESLLSAAVVAAVFWTLWRSVDALVDLIIDRSWASQDASARSMLMVGGNLLKAAVVVTGAVTVVATFGYPVTTVLAGLGIGGIAFAFGAQKTVEHLFGSIAIATDQPCRVGDVIRVDDLVGKVEHIGTRSTRIRTADRTVVTIPNGRLADQRIESYAARDRMRLGTVITLAYGASEAQLRQVVAGIEGVLLAHPLVWTDQAVARLSNLGAASVDIEVQCWFQTTDFEVFRTCRQDVLLGILRVVEQAGVQFAQLGQPPAPSPPPPTPLPAA